MVIKNIIYEMMLGNFSFAILVVGIVQVFCMLRGAKDMNNDNKEKVIAGINDVQDDSFRGIEVLFKNDGADTWLLENRKQFTIHGNELVIFDVDGKFMAWYNLKEVISISVLDDEDIVEDDDTE